MLFVTCGADIIDAGDAASHDFRASVLELGREPPLPHVGGLDDVVVDTDDLRDLSHLGLLAPTVAALVAVLVDDSDQVLAVGGGSFL